MVDIIVNQDTTFNNIFYSGISNGLESSHSVSKAIVNAVPITYNIAKNWRKRFSTSCRQQ